MNEKHKQISKNILMTSVIQDSFKNVQRKFNQYNLIRDESYFDYELLKAALDRRHQAIVNLLLKLRCRVRNPNKINSEETALHLAMQLDNSQIIKKILKNGASIYDKNIKGETAVHAGFKSGYHHAVNTVLNFFCLENGKFSQLDPLKQDDVTHFNIACVLNNLIIAELYLDFGFDVNRPFSLDSPELSGVYPLHYAVKKNYSDLFKLFIRHGADISIKNSNGKTPLHILYYYGSYGSDMIASAFNYENETKFINSVDDNGVSHFHLCCTVNNPDAVKVFIDKGVDVNSAISLTCPIYPGFTPLHFAVKHNCHKVIKLLLENGADCKKVDAKGTTPLHLACEKANYAGIEAIIRTLLDYEACPAAADQKGLTPLHIAFYKQQNLTANIFENLISKITTKVNFTDQHGLSHFHIVCARGDIYISGDPFPINIQKVEDFLESGVAVDSCVVTGFYSGYTALHFAVLFTQYFTAELLLQKNAQVNIKTNKYQLTPLHVACKFDGSANLFSESDCIRNRTKLIKLLLQYKANVNAKTNNSETPLQMFIESMKNIDYINHLSRYQNILCILLEYGSDVHAKDKNGRTMLQIAIKENLAFVIEKLLYYGADINIDLSDNLFTSSLINTDICYLEMVQVLFIHVQKLLALGLYVNEKLKKGCIQLRQRYQNMSLNINNVSINLDSVFDKCIEELERMKIVKIDTYTSLRSILLKSTHELSKHLKNSNLVKILEDQKTYDNFPLYTCLLKVPFKKALIRSAILESANASLSTIIGLNLPEPCCDSILKYLTNEEVANLKTAVLRNSFKRKINNDSGCSKNNSSEMQPSTKMQKKP